MLNSICEEFYDIAFIVYDLYIGIVHIKGYLKSVTDKDELLLNYHQWFIDNSKLFILYPYLWIISYIC